MQKNAGTSIVRSLVPHIGSDCEIYGSTPDGHILSDYNKPMGKLWKHIEARNAKKQIDIDIWNEYFKFAFVRNPWSRILSQYSWWTQNTWDDEKKTGDKVRKMKNFEEYLVQKIGIVPNQKLQLFEEDIPLVDYIGRFEYLEEDFNEDHIPTLNTLPFPVKGVKWDTALADTSYFDNVAKQVLERFETSNKSSFDAKKLIDDLDQINFVRDVLTIRMSVAPGKDNTEKFTWATRDGAHTSKFTFKTESID